MTPQEVMAAAERRWMLSGVRGLTYGIGRLAERLGLDGQTACAGVLFKEWCFARVAQEPADPRRFRLVEEAGDGSPALLVPVHADDVDGPQDIIALALTGGRFWRLTLSCAHIEPAELEERPDVLRLRQDVHAYMRRVIRCAAVELMARTEGRDTFDTAAHHRLTPLRAAAGVDPDHGRVPVSSPSWRSYMGEVVACTDMCREREDQVRRLHLTSMPDGVLVVDPHAFDWTRRGMLKDVERIEILDAPATGVLGRALRRLNPLIGTPRGVELVGAQPMARAA